jgi:hypothetical protein
MSTLVWIIVWAVIIGVVAYFLVRERLSGRKGPDDFDRTQHEAVGESTMNSQTHGPGTTGIFGP